MSQGRQNLLWERWLFYGSIERGDAIVAGRCVNSSYAVHDVDGEEGGREIVPAGARYHSRLRRTAGGWKISELIIYETWEDPRVPGLYAD